MNHLALVLISVQLVERMRTTLLVCSWLDQLQMELLVARAESLMLRDVVVVTGQDDVRILNETLV